MQFVKILEVDPGDRTGSSAGAVFFDPLQKHRYAINYHSIFADHPRPSGL